ncbi:hypothetical protein KBH77_00350 [Patescibacteria group bacterium]|nr:hypothetical protein [Patescibacteria group bacterium]
MKNGTIMICGPDSNDKLRRVFDLKITNGFPIISTTNDDLLIECNNKTIDHANINHISIPADLNIHLTGKLNEHYFFSETITNNGLLNKDSYNIFSLFSVPIENYEFPVGTWHQAEIHGIGKDKAFNNKTAMFIEFFVFKNDFDLDILNSLYPLKNISMRERRILGPYNFNEIIRKDTKNIKPNFKFAIRFGFYQNSDNKSKIIIPFNF